MNRARGEGSDASKPHRITWQVPGFTATSLRGFHRTKETSTILYGRLLADKVVELDVVEDVSYQSVMIYLKKTHSSLT